MRWRRKMTGGARLRPLLLWLAVVIAVVCPPAAGSAHGVPAAAPSMDNAMSSAGWLQDAFVRFEDEVIGDVSMLPAAPAAIAREWRTFDRDGSALGALVNLGWVILAAALAWAVEWILVRRTSHRLRRAMWRRAGGPTVAGLFLLLLCDGLGLAAFAGTFVYSRHWLTGVGATAALIILSAKVLIRWRIAAVIFRVLLRPDDPPARLLELSDHEARGLGRFLSVATLAIMLLVGFGRYGLMDEDSGAPHVIALLVVIAVCAIDALIVFRARTAAEDLIRGCGTGFVASMRAAIARAWPVIGVTYVAGVFVFFVFGLSLGVLSYFYAAVSTLGVILVMLVLERLTDKGWRQSRSASLAATAVERVVEQGLRRILRAIALLIAAIVLAWIWARGIEATDTGVVHVMRTTAAAGATLFVAYLAWELLRMGIDRHLQDAPLGPKLPGAADEVEATPGSRLQTVLPLLRIMIGGLIGVIATLVVLSRLGIDTAPLIAGAGVFGLAISFGSQSLVRDIISGLFYMWDDAFRIGEYIDTGRLKGTVEALGIRSLKLRHHNGPLHTIPYGQLGAVSNQSRDFATLKFNLRLEPGTDIELVRKTAKRIGLEMQEVSEIASEVILPLKMQGIAEITDTAVVLRFKFTARPVKPSWVQREYLKRMYVAFTEKGIAFASGALTLHTVGPPLEAPPRGAPLVPLPGGRSEEPPKTLNLPAAQTQPA